MAGKKEKAAVVGEQRPDQNTFFTPTTWACVQHQQEELLQQINEKVKKNELCVFLGRKKLKGVRWMMTFDNGLDFLAKSRLNGETLRVLLYMMKYMEFENYIKITQQQLADELGMRRQHISRSIKKLCEKNIIEKVKKGRDNYYRLNPEIAWRGSVTELEKIVDINEFREKQLAAVPTPF
jgi:biotin operon repressor